MSNHYYILAIIISLIFGSLAYLCQLKGVLLAILVLLWVYSLIFSLRNIDKKIAFCSFLVTFFVFLLGRIFIDNFFPGFESDYTMEVDNRDSYSKVANYFVLYSLILSLSGLCIGYLSKNKVIVSNKIENPVYLKRIREISKRMTIFFFLFVLLVTFEKIRYILDNGYINYYLTFKESLPHICYTLASSYKFAFFIFLASFPSKKEVWPLLFLYLMEACVSLLTGQRGSFITPLLFVIIYFFVRNSLSPQDPWIGRKGKIALVVTIPILCASMFLVMLLRGDNETGSFDFFTLFLNFFYQQGGSQVVVGFAYDFEPIIPKGQWYSLGPLIRFFSDNPITNILGISESIEYQSIEMATKGHELGSFITYRADPNRYFSGGNLASSYVAELWLDFGYIGILIGSFIYGRILASISFLSKPNIWKTTVLFIMIYRIMLAPRASFALFITDCLSFSFIIMILYMLGRCKGIPHYISIK